MDSAGKLLTVSDHPLCARAGPVAADMPDNRVLAARATLSLAWPRFGYLRCQLVLVERAPLVVEDPANAPATWLNHLTS